MWKLNICRTLACIAILFGSHIALANIEIDTSIKVTQGDTLEVLSAYTNVHIYSWDEMAVSLSGKTDPNISEYEFKLHEGTVRYTEIIGTRVKQKSYTSPNTLTIKVPKNIDITVRTAFGDVHIQRVRGEVEVSTEIGKIDLHKIEDKLKVTTHEGRIKISRTTAQTEVSTLNGNVEIYNSGGDFEINSIDGNVYSSSDFQSLKISNVDGTSKLKFTTVGDLSVSSSNGDIDIQTTILEKTRANLKSVSGNIQISTPPISNAEFKIQTHQGKIKNYVNKTDPNFDKTKGIETLFFRVGEVSSKFEAMSVKGSITLFTLDNIPKDKNHNFAALHLKKLSHSDFDNFYANPEMIIEGLQTIYFEPLEVSFSHDWEDHFGRQLPNGTTQELKTLYNNIFQQRISERFSDTDKFNLVSKREDAYLTVKPRIVISAIQQINNQEEPSKDGLEYFGVTQIELNVATTEDDTPIARVTDFGCGCVNSYENYKDEASLNVRAYKKVFYWWAKELFENLGGQVIP